jgi:hypothetical protein
MKSARSPSVLQGVCFCTFFALNVANAQSPTPRPSVEQRVTDLEKRLSALESITAIALALKLKTQTNQDAAAPSPTPRSDSPIELVDWNFSFEVGQYNQSHYKITYTLKNRADKAIKLNQSAIEFRDLLGEKVYGIRVSQDLKMPPGKEITDTGYYDANPFIPSQMRLKEMAKENVKAELVVSKAVFSDNSIYSAQDSK